MPLKILKMWMLQLDFNDLNKVLQASMRCQFKEKWHLYCPGCGGTRAIFLLIHGHILKSLLYNPIPVVLLLDLIIFATTSIIEKKKNKRNAYVWIKVMSKVVVLLIILIFFTVRNYLLVYKGIDFLGDLT